MNERDVVSSSSNSYDPYENALAERMNGILKTEFFPESGFSTTQLARLAIEEAIDDTYNALRPHVSLAMKTPYKMHQNKSPKVGTLGDLN